MLAGRSLKYNMHKQNIDDILIVNNLRVNFNIKNDNIFKKNTVLTAVDNISFNIKKGKTLGLVGESGCGKTTTGQALLGLIQTTAGKIFFDKENITNISYKEFLPKRHKIQIIFQDPYSSLNPRQTAEEIIRDPLDIHNIGNNKERINKVKELMKLVGLRENQMKLYPHQFSGGQRQRICIARALALNPDFIVWPEASTPYALNQDSAWVEGLATQSKTPLLIGAVLRDADSIYNTISEILPDTGFENNWYAKRILVPFGEYVPFPFKWIPGLRKLVGPIGSFKEGQDVKTFTLKLNS